MDDESEISGVNNENEYSKYTSSVWKCFDVIKKDFTAKCKACNKLLSYRSSISNLKKHYLRKHGQLGNISDDEDEESVEEVTFLDEEVVEPELEYIDKRTILRSQVWEYFEVVDEEDKQAICKICREQFSYRTTSTNLAKHLRRRHFRGIEDVEFKPEKETEDDVVDEVYDGGDDENEDGDSDDKTRRSKTSMAWEYFTIKDSVQRVAICKLCDSEYSYLTSVSNLVKHVRVKHGLPPKVEEETVQLDEDYEVTKQESPHPRNRSSVWLYFKRVDDKAKIAVCLICKSQLSHLTSISNLKKHLYRKHPGLELNNNKKMLIANDGQLYEIDDAANQDHINIDEDQDTTDPIEFNTIYLDDYENNKPEKKRKRKSSNSSIKMNSRTYLDETTGLTETLSSDEEVTFQRRYVRKQQDSLDQFGKYLVSLLKQLPKEISNQLQADFVKQVMAAELKYESQKANSSPNNAFVSPNNAFVTPNNGYAITITELHNGEPEGHDSENYEGVDAGS